LESAGGFTFVAQTGDVRKGEFVRSAAFPDVPIFSDLLRPTLKDPKEIKAFEAWETLVQIGKWMALPPDTPAQFVSAYRQAFAQIAKDRQFIAAASNVLGEDFPIATGEEMQQVTLVADEISDDTLKFFDQLRERVGIHVEATHK
jgi:hypothetical protein